MGKRIALFCDGTWNDRKQPYPTNVRLLFESTANTVDQKAYYFAGVGAEYEKLLGGFGVGLNRILRAVYWQLCQDYERGDEIFLIGFSRGAYMARSITGLIRKCGIVPPERVDEAIALYRRRESPGPDSPAALEFRRKHAVDAHDKSLARTQPSTCLTVKYLGIWETVGALGVPERFPGLAMFNKRYRFHDCDISTIVENARHALAVDEHRRALPHTPWTQASIDRVNSFYGAHRIEQSWFPGDHGSIGGGGFRDELSQGALLWIADGAEGAGLTFADSKCHLARARIERDAVNGLLRNADADNFWLDIQGHGPRTKSAPSACADLSPELRQRCEDRLGYLGEDSKRGAWRRSTLSAVLSKSDPIALGCGGA